MSVPVYTVVTSSAGPFRVKVADPDHPQMVEAIIYRFRDVQTLEAEIGNISENQTEVDLGTAAEIEGKYFLVDGGVIPFGGSIATQYEVIVRVLDENDSTVSAWTAQANGRGTVGNEIVYFRAPFNFSFGK